MKEKELYRLIRSQVRAYETLKESKLPKNMELQKQRKKLESEIKEKNEREALRNSKIFQTMSAKKVKKSSTIPNYDDLYKKFSTELEVKKSLNQKLTVCKPFKLQTKERANKRSVVKRPTSASSIRTDINMHSINVVNEIDQRLS